MKLNKQADVESKSRVNFQSFLSNQGLVFGLILIIIVFSILSKTFLTWTNMFLVLRQVSIIGIMACGMTFVLISGNFDLSVGSLLSFSTVLCVNFVNTIGLIPALILTCIVGVLVGMVNGYLVGYLKLNSMIVTLGMMSVLLGSTYIISGGLFTELINPEKSPFTFIGRGFIGSIPFPVILYLICIIVFGVLLNKTVFGRQLKAVGGNPKAAKFSGINDKRIVFTTFVISGLTCAIGGMIIGSRVAGAQNNMGAGYEFDVITAVILGGTSLYGGEGSVYKTVLGVLIMGFLFNGFIMVGLPYYFQWFVEWFIIIAIVWIDVLSKKKEGVL